MHGFFDNPVIWGIYAWILGLCVGSFLNVVAYRLPLMLEKRWQDDCRALLEQNTAGSSSEVVFNLCLPASHCPHCQQTIRWHENIPLLSWLALRGRCAHCRQLISARYPLVEFGTAMLSLVTVMEMGLGWPTAFALLLVWTLIACSIIDLDRQLLPDDLTLPLLWLGLLLNSQHLYVSAEDAILGAVLGYLLLWTVYWLFRLSTGKEGMGYGDFKLLAALGAWMGWQALPLIILMASLCGAIAGIVYLVMRRQSLAFPFGPYLAIAGYLFMIERHPLMFLLYGHG